MWTDFINLKAIAVGIIGSAFKLLNIESILLNVVPSMPAPPFDVLQELKYWALSVQIVFYVIVGFVVFITWYYKNRNYKRWAKAGFPKDEAYKYGININSK